MKDGLDRVKDATVFIGVATPALYVMGYVAERVHWNVLGYVEIPPGYELFLYRGGIVVIASIAGLLLNSLQLAFALNFWAALWWLAVCCLIVGKNVGGSADYLARYYRSLRPEQVLLAGLGLIGILIASELCGWPAPPGNVLFEQPDQEHWARYQAFFQHYVGACGLVLLCWICSTPHPVSASPVVLPEELVPEKAPTSAPLRWMHSATGWFLLLGLFLLPAVYGSYQYSCKYPVVRVWAAKDAPKELVEEVASMGPMALLMESKDEYVFYCRPDKTDPNVLKLKKAQFPNLEVKGTVDLGIRGPLAPPKFVVPKGGE